MKFYSSVALALLLGLATVSAETEDSTVAILPLGDSITEIPVSYRYPLMKRLQEAGYQAKYVGSKTSYANPAYPEMGKLAHEGYGGKTVQFLAERIKTTYPKNRADIVLLHAGHNQFADQLPIPGVIEATREIIRYIRSVTPHTAILLAQVIPAGKLPKYSYIPELNVELGKLAHELDRPDQRVIVVNQAEGFDWRTDTVDDLVHPNVAGGEKMAEQWYKAIVPLLPAPAREAK